MLCLDCQSASVMVMCFPLYNFDIFLIIFVDFDALIYFHQIIVLENGKVVEQGPHEILLSKAGRYAQLWGQQNNTADGVDTSIKVLV